MMALLRVVLYTYTTPFDHDHADSIHMQTFNPVIYAWGPTDTLEYHMTRRGSQAVNFVQGDKGPSVPSDAKTFQLRVDNVSVWHRYACACINYHLLLSHRHVNSGISAHL